MPCHNYVSQHSALRWSNPHSASAAAYAMRPHAFACICLLSAAHRMTEPERQLDTILQTRAIESGQHTCERGLPSDNAIMSADACEDAVNGRQPRRRSRDVAAQLRSTHSCSEQSDDYLLRERDSSLLAADHNLAGAAAVSRSGRELAASSDEKFGMRRHVAQLVAASTT